MYIKRVVLTETGTYSDMWSRGYAGSLKGDTLNRFRRSTDNGTNLTMNAFASVGGEVLRPVSTVESPVDIVGGWGEKKFRFMMEIVHQGTIAGSERVDILGGYTNYMGYIPTSGLMDPRMELHINGITSIQLVPRLDQHNRRTTMLHIQENCQLLPGYFNAAKMESSGYFLAPQDIFDGIGLTHAVGSLATHDDYRVVDSRNFTLRDPRLSRRGNNHAGSYLSRVMSSFQTSLNGASINTATMDSIYTNAKKSVAIADPTVEDNMSLRTLCSQTDFTHRRFVTWGELLAIRPDLENVTDVSLKPLYNTSGEREAVRGDGANWDGANNETLTAVIVANTLPTIMSDAKVTKLVVSMTNETRTGTSAIGLPYSVTVHDMRHFAAILQQNGDFMRDTAQVLAQRLATELMPGLTFNNQMVVTVTANCDILGDTFIDVSIGGGPVHPYTNPQWCDARTAPTITTDSRRRNELSNHIHGIMENLTTQD